MQKFIFILLITIGLSGCVGSYEITKGRHNLFSPTPAFMRKLPDGSDSYSQGFRDGCNTLLGSIGGGTIRQFSFDYDPNKGIEDKNYYTGFRLGSNYCTYYTDVDPL